MSYLMHLSGGVTRHAIGDYECNSHVPLVDFVKLVDTRGRRRGSRWFLCGVVGERGFGLARLPPFRRSIDSESRMPFRLLTFMPSRVYCSPRPLIETPSVGQMARISSGTSRATAFTVKTRCHLNGLSPWCLETSMAMDGKTWLLCLAVVQHRAQCEVMASVLSHG